MFRRRSHLPLLALAAGFALLSMAAAPPAQAEVTVTSTGKIQVLDSAGTVLSSHVAPEEAFESAANRSAGTYVIRTPDRRLVVLQGSPPATTTPTTPAPTTPAAADWGTTYHVRADGGTADQCTGKANAAYPGSGTAQACAWKGPMVALPPSGGARFAGGDKLVIHAGQYVVGLDAPGAVGCSSSWPWDCVLAAIPSGSSPDKPTRILGEGYDSGCIAPPQLWGTERAQQVLSLNGSSNVQVSCLEITDHASCAENHTGGLACNRDKAPFGQWAPTGIYGANSTNVTLSNLNIHGLAGQGILAGAVKDWTLTNVKIVGNGSAGWNGDLAGRGLTSSSNSGTLRFTAVAIEWNGCVETYPGLQPSGCWGQSAGGYGDGLGTARTGGNWIFEDSSFKHNVSDGLDLLYADGTGSVVVTRVWSEGNASNQIKIAGPAAVTNLVAIGNCGYFDGKAFTFKVDPCRAVGDTVVLQALAPGQAVSLVNSTVLGQGNVIVNVSGPAGSNATLLNNVLAGWAYYYDPTTNSADTYVTGGITVAETYTTKQNLRNAKCAGSVVCGSAGLVGAMVAAPDPALAAGSGARDTGQAVGGLVPAVDFLRKPRPAGAGVDRGALEAQ